MGSMSKTLGALALASSALFAGDALAGTLDQIRDSKTMRIAYDPDAPPYSYIVPGSPSNADPAGLFRRSLPRRRSTRCGSSSRSPT